MNFPMNQTNSTQKSFWSKPENYTKTVVLSGIAIGGVVLFFNILPILLTLVANTIYLVLMLGGLGTGLFAITNKKIRATVSILFNLSMKRLTSFIVKTDPIAILEIGIRKMESRLEKFEGCLSNLRGSEARLAAKIDKNLRAANSAMKSAELAKQQSQMNDQVYLMSRQAGRLQRTNKTFAELLTQVRTISEKLMKIFKNSKIVIEDTKNEVTVLKEEWEIKKQTFGALQSAMSIYNGNKDERALFEEALEFISDDISNKTGQIEHMFSMSEDIMNSIDLQNGVIQQEGLQMLDEWEKNADGWLQTSETSPVKQVKGLQQSTPESASTFSNLFNK